MSNFLTPIKILLDMDIKTKSTYREALHGLDMYMVKTLNDLGYNEDRNSKDIGLYRKPTDLRLSDANNRFRNFLANPEVGLLDFVKYSGGVMRDFLSVVKLGYLHKFSMSSNGKFDVNISCLLHPSGIDNTIAERNRFEDQLSSLRNIGLEVVKAKGLNSYRFVDTDNNRKIISGILSDRKAKMIRFHSCVGNIDNVEFTLEPADLNLFTTKPSDYSMPVSDELNDDEFLKMKKLVGEIPFSLAGATANPDMLQECCFVAEISFSDLCETVGYQGDIYNRVKSRYAKEKAANMDIHEIEKEIGLQFPVEITRDTMEKIAATLAYFCVENLHATTNSLSIDEWGYLRLNIRICKRSDDLVYAYYFDNTKYNTPTIPDALINEVFDVANNRNGCMRIIDNEANRNLIAEFVRSVCKFDVDAMSIVRDDCYITSTKFGEDTTQLKSVFVIDEVSVVVDHIDGILRQCDLCKITKS